MAKKILVVDDVDVERMGVAAVLKKLGHTVIQASNGLLGFEAAKQHMPDLIIMDIVMPEMDGFGATKRIMLNPDTRNIPIVILSSKAQQSDMFRAKQLGARAYLVKPVSAESLGPILQQLL